MAVEIIMPKAGMAMEEGTIVKWLKEEGDFIKEGDTIVEILTDKVNMEVEAESTGYLIKKVRFEDEVMPVFTVIGYIGEMGENIEAAGEASKKEEVKKTEEKIETKDNSVFNNKALLNPSKLKRATPAARKMAREENAELGAIEGTGPRQRIQALDVANYISENKAGEVKATPLAKKISEAEGIDLKEISGTGVKGKIFKRDIAVKELPEMDIVPLTGIRKVISERMSESYFSAPTFTLNIEVEVSKLLELKERITEEVKQETGEKLTINDLLVLVTSKALEKYRSVNVSLVKEGILYHNEINIALAVTGNGVLMVPVIKNTERKGIKEIVKEGKELIRKAREGKLGMEDQSGSTITISNLGMYGVHYFNPIINQPNSSILGVGTIEEKVYLDKGEVKSKKVMYLSSTFDHRVIDGSLGAEYMQYMKKLIEEPYLMMV